MFIGMDILAVQYLGWKAKKLARKWGGQCIVFIDEIDAVGMRRTRSSAARRRDRAASRASTTTCFYGPSGALTRPATSSLETPAWRERMFAERAGPAEGGAQAFLGTLGRRIAGPSASPAAWA